MERLLSPCTRLPDILESRGRLFGLRDHPEHLQEINLYLSTEEELLSAERAPKFGYMDLYAILGQDTLAWLTPHAAVARLGERGLVSWHQLVKLCHFCFIADGKDIIALARSSEHLLEICDIALQILAASAVYSKMEDIWYSVCDSLKTHPNLQEYAVLLSPAVLNSRIQALADMLKGNMSLYIIYMSVIPVLEMNRLRPRVHAIQKNSPNCVRSQGAGTSASRCSFQ
jgi:hypothetical protein